MPIDTLITNDGMTEVIAAQGNQGWYLFPESFSLAETQGTFDATRIDAPIWVTLTSYTLDDKVTPIIPNGFFYEAVIAGITAASEPTFPTTVGAQVTDGSVTWENKGATSGRLEATWFGPVNITTRIADPPNSVEVVLVIPPGSDSVQRTIGEIYLFAKDQQNNTFLLSIGQPDFSLVYDPQAQEELRLRLTIDNVNVGSLFNFNVTQVAEITAHDTDPTAHSDIRAFAKMQLDLLSNGEMQVDRGSHNLSAGTFGFGPADWEGQLVGDTSIVGTFDRHTASALGDSGLSARFTIATLTDSGVGEEIHIRRRVRSETARKLSNKAWTVSTIYVDGDIVVPTDGNLNGRRFLVTTGGTSSSAEPSWDTVLGNTTADGSVIWTTIKGDTSLQFKVLHDLGLTVFAIIAFKRPTSGVDDFGGTVTTFDTSTGLAILSGAEVLIEHESLALPDMTNGLEIEITIPTGAVSGKVFEFVDMKLERSEDSTEISLVPFELDDFLAAPYAMPVLRFDIRVGLQADVDKGLATHTINTLPTIVDDDRILILDGSHVMSAPIAITAARVVIKGISLAAIIDQASTHSFTVSGANSDINVRFTNGLVGGVIVNGAASILTAPGLSLVNTAISNGARVETTGTAGGYKRSSSAEPLEDRELIDRNYLLHDSPFGFNKVIGTAGQVTAGRATHTIVTFNASGIIVAGDRILLLDGTHILTQAEDVTPNEVIFVGESQAAILDVGAFTFTMSGSNARCALPVINAGVGDIRFSGVGSKFLGFDVALTAVTITNGSQVETTGTAGGIKRGSSLAPGNDRELVEKQYVDSLGLISHDIIIGTSGQVTDGDATHTIADFNASGIIQDGFRILVKSGTHVLTQNEDILPNNIIIEKEDQNAIISFSSFTLTFSGNNGVQDLRLAGVGSGDIIHTGTQHQTMLLIDSPPADPLLNSGGNFIVWNENVVIDGGLHIEGTLNQNITNVTGATSSHNASNELVIIGATTVALQINLPGSLTFPRVYLIKNIGNTIVTVVPDSADTIEGQANLEIADQFATAQLQYDPTNNEWHLFALSSTGASGASQESLTYQSLLEESIFKKLYFDTFAVRDTMDLEGSPVPVYSSPSTGYVGSLGTQIAVPGGSGGIPEGVLPSGNVTVFFKFMVHAEADLIFNEHFTIQTVADVADSLDGKFFTAFSPADETGYYFLFQTSGGSNPDPAPVGFTRVIVNIATGASANANASTLQSKMDALDAFTASVVTDTVTVKTTENRISTDAADGQSPDDTGFTITITQKGGVAEYSTDGGGPSGGSGGWTEFDMDDIIVIAAGFVTLHIRWVWNDTGNMNSFGVIFKEGGQGYHAAVKMSEQFVVPSNVTGASIVTLPNNAVYSVGKESLLMHINGILELDGIDYTENDSRSVNILHDLTAGQVISFQEFYGGIDTSVENQTRLDFEHAVSGSHRYESVTIAQAIYNALVTDDTIYVNHSANVTVNLPTAVGQDGMEINVKNLMASFSVTVVSQSGEDIDGGPTWLLATQYQSLTVRSDGIDWWII